jgi:UDP-glucose 4-epimerase
MMSYSNRSVLVTGADGFIGSHVTEALAAAGASVTALACYNSFDAAGWLDDLAPETRAAIEVVRGDVRDPGMMRRLCEGKDVVLHLAALIAIPYSYVAPQSYVDTNVTGTVNVLEAARFCNVGRVVVTSTSEVYGTALYTPIDEKHPLQGQSPYSASKIGADMIAESFARSFDLPVVILRPFNTYGPRQSERAVISTVIRQVLDPTCDAIRLGDLSPTRDFNFATDTAQAFLAAGLASGLDYGSPYNAATGEAVTIGEMVELVRQITGTDKPILTEDTRMRPAKSEVRLLMGASERLRAASGWAPQVSLREGLAQTVDWWQARLKRGLVRQDSGYMV